MYAGEDASRREAGACSGARDGSGTGALDWALGRADTCEGVLDLRHRPSHFQLGSLGAGRIVPPITVGHEFCGEVVEIGSDVTTVKVGDYVSAESHITCGAASCAGPARAHVCQNTQIIGVDRDGCWAEYIAMPEQNIWHNPPDLPLEIASIQENFGNAVHTAFVTDLTARKVLVTGCGPVGLMTIAVAKAGGASAIYATDIAPYRLRLAKKMGADLALNVAEGDVVERILAHTGGEGVDVLLEMSGAAQAINQGFQLLKFGGEAALLGLTPAPIPFDLNNHITFKGATVYGIAGRQLWGTWYRCQRPLYTRVWSIWRH